MDYLIIQTSHFPVDAPPCLWLTFRVHPSGRVGSSYIGPLPLPPGGLLEDGRGPGELLGGWQVPPSWLGAKLRFNAARY